MARCLITGCELIDPDQGKWCHGDLWVEGGCYVHNAVLVDGEAAWKYDEPPTGTKAVIVCTDDYFERRGVIVVEILDAELNALAREYIGD